MARLAKSYVHGALDWAAAKILEADGGDGIVSRRDLRRALDGLQGVERSLVDALYRLIDRRDDAPGARITRGDVDRTMAYAKERLVDVHDDNRNGLSQDEIDRMSTLGKLAVELVRVIERKAVLDEGTSEALARRLGELSEGLVFDDFGTEGTTERFTVVHVEASLQALTEQTLAQTLGLDLSDPKQEIARFITDLEEFYVRLIELTMMLEQVPVTRAHDLVALMQGRLRGTVAAILGRDGPEGPGAEHPVYIVGIAPDGDLVGLRSIVVWT